MAEEVGTAFVSILPSFRGFSAKLRQELRGELRGIDPVVGEAGHRAGRSFGSSMSSSLRSAMGSIGGILKTGLVAGTAAAVAGLGAITFFGLKSAAALEQTQIGFESLLGSAEAAKSTLGELRDFAKSTPFEFQGIADSSRRILGFASSVGIAREQLIPTLTTIGDLVSLTAGGQEQIDSVVRALGQIASKGKVSQEELLQLAEALPGFNVNAGIAAQLGLSVADSMELISAGGLDATTGVDALLKAMAAVPGAAGAMEKQSQTLLGVFSNFKDTISQTLTDAFQPAIPAIKQSLSELTPVIETAFSQLAPALGGLLTAVLPLLGDLVTGLSAVLAPVVEGLSSGLGGIGAVFTPLGQAIGTVLAAIAPLTPILAVVIGEVVKGLTPAIAELAPVIAVLAPPIAEVVMALVPLIPLIADLLLLAVQILLPFTKLGALWLSLIATKSLGPLVRGIADAFQWLIGAVRTAVEWVTKVADWRDIIGKAKEQIVKDLMGIVIWFDQLPGKIRDALKGAGTWLVDVGRDMIQGLIDGAGNLLGRIGQFLLDKLPDWIVTPFKKALGIASPSKLFAGFGEDTVAGYVQGVENSARTMTAATTGMAAAAAAGPSASAAAPPQRVEVSSSDALIAAAIDAIRERIRTQFGGDPDLALATG